jgi:hypothetical protein
MSQKVVDKTIETEAPTADTRSEIKLLLCCSRTCITPEIAERIINLVQENLDWTYLLKTAQQHRVMPLLHQSLNAVCPETVPQSIRDRLRISFHLNTIHNLFLTEELLRLVELFAARNIPAIPFKGPTLAVYAYGDLGFRQCSDLDIVVHKQDIFKAKDLLMAQGYQNRYEMSSYQEAERLRQDHEYDLVHKNGKVAVDLHWGFTQIDIPFPLNPKYLWQRLQPISLAGKTIPNAAPEDLLLILCVNGCKECWQTLNRICDIAELIRNHPELNWEQAIEQARRLGSQRMLIIALFLAKDLLGTVLPESVQTYMQFDLIAQNLAQQVQNRIFSDAAAPLENVERATFVINMRERFIDKASSMFNRINMSGWMTPTHNDNEFIPLPTKFLGLYYLLRPIRVLKKYYRLIKNLQ